MKSFGCLLLQPGQLGPRRFLVDGARSRGASCGLFFWSRRSQMACLDGNSWRVILKEGLVAYSAFLGSLRFLKEPLRTP